MTEQEHQRFEFLRLGPCVPGQYVLDYYGLNWPLTQDLRPDFDTWRKQLRRQAACNENQTSRHELEAFMQQMRVTTKKWMAARLGMQVASLEELLPRLKEIGMHPQRYVIYGDLVAESLSEDLIPNLPGLKFRTFYDHNSFCERLHVELQDALKFKIQPMYCPTADRINDYPRQYANNFDCITLAPLSGKHQVWLDFHKPLNLGPDRCSKLFYAENRDILRQYCAGTQEPDDLDKYAPFFAEPQHV